MKAEFLPFEESIKKILNQKGYLKYDKHIFKVGNTMHNPNMLCILLSIQVTRDSVVSDALLLQHFRDAVHGIFPTVTSDVVSRVHGILLRKIYNTRSNEFLRSIGKIECFRKKKAVDVNIGLRHKLKSYPAEKQSGTASNIITFMYFHSQNIIILISQHSPSVTYFCLNSDCRILSRVFL